MRRAIRKHAVDFAAVVGLCLVGLIVGGYILSNQRLYLPDSVPVLGTDFVDYKAEFATSQSVTPGQGQTVQIAGVDVGDISKVELVDGRAVVSMKIRRKFTPIYKDATALLRPKTGLNDMVIALEPGSRRAGEAPKGWAVPVRQTLPNVNADEILASLDKDTLAYLQLLLGGAGEALEDNGVQLSATLRRFEPTARDLARLNGALSERRANIERSIHNFRLVAEAIGEKDDQLARLVDASNRSFRAFANQDDRLREALRLLPGTLQETNTALSKADRLGKELGPTLGALRPAARALGPSLEATRPFLTTTTPIVRDQLRPFSRDVLPVAKVLRPAARDLAALTPDLVSSFKTLNRLFNTLAYNPPGKEEGYLFWASWVNHAGALLFGTQDAHGPIRRGLVMASCSSLATLEALVRANVNPSLTILTELLNAPANADVCPTSSQPPTSGAAATARTKGRAR